MRRAPLMCGLVLVAIVFVPAMVHSQSGQPRSTHPSLNSQMGSLKNGTFCERTAAIFALHQQGRRAIPALISRMDDAELAEDSGDLISNPIISTRPLGSQNDYFAGELYAYVLELILGRGTLSRDPEHCEFYLTPDDYAYSIGTLQKRGNHAITATDLPLIKQIYSDWWAANRKKTLAELQQDWKQASRPLTRSQFIWQSGGTP